MADSAIAIWDLDAKKELRRFECPSGGVKATAFSPDGKTLACLTVPDGIDIRDVQSVKQLKQINREKFASKNLLFTRRQVPGGLGDGVQVWETNAWKSLQAVADPRFTVCDVVFPAKDRVLACAFSGVRVLPGTSSRRNRPR